MSKTLSRHRPPLLTPLLLALSAAWPLQVLAQSKAGTLPPVAPLALPVPAATGWRSNPAGAAFPTPTVPGQLNIQQSVPREIYNWQSFNIGSQAAVTFAMPTGGGAALNRIADQNPSQIFGKLSATNGGEIYLINPNGILFGAGAQVNVGALFASTLNLADGDFMNGLTGPIAGGTAAFQYQGSADNFVDTRNFVRVDSGASITTAEGGRIMLFAKRVENAGTLSAPGGQVVLGGGASVYLKLPTTEVIYASEQNPAVPALRGLLVEMGSGPAGAADRNGSVVNEAGGVITTPRGNSTLVGMAVNQMGKVSATTSVSQNGSILLLAQGGATTQTTLLPGQSAVTSLGRSTTTGTLVLGTASETTITPDNNGADGKPLLSSDNATFVPSRIDMVGRRVTLQGGAQVAAPGADLSVRALGAPDYAQAIGGTDAPTAAQMAADANVVIEAGARIDLSGTTDTTVSVARNFVTTDFLGSNDLADAPLQKDGLLYQNKVTVDIRGRSPILGSLASYRNALLRSADERLSGGGSARIFAGGAVLMQQGASIDVSGGAVNYTGAQVAQTMLTAQNGQSYSLSTAPADLVYTGISNASRNTVSYDRWGQVTQYGSTTGTVQAQGYVQGSDAGSLQVLAPRVFVDGSVAGRTTIGYRQAAGLDARAALGQLTLGTDQNVAALGNGSFAGAILGSFSLGAGAVPLDAGLFAQAEQGSVSTQLPATSRMAAAQLNDSGFGRVTIVADGLVSTAAGADLHLPTGGALKLESNGGGLALAGSVTAPSGAVTVQAAGGAIAVAGTADIDVSGQWINNQLGSQPASAFGSTGGSIAIASTDAVRLDAGSVLNVSGGGLVSASGAISGGNAGSIALAAGRAANTADASSRSLSLGATLEGFSMASGGSLSLTTQFVRIGAAQAGDAAGTLDLGADFFSRGGFAAFSIDGRQALTFTPGTVLAPLVQTWVPGLAATQAASGSEVAALTTGRAPAGTLPQAMSLAFKSSGLDATSPAGRLLMPEGVAISLPALSTLSLSAAETLEMDGRITAPGGKVSLAAATQGNDFADPQYLWLGGSSVIDVSGQALISPSTDGRLRGSVLAGGSISLTAGGSNYTATTAAAASSLVWQQGSQLLMNGAAAPLDVSTLGAAGLQTQRQTVASAGGSLSISGNFAMALEGHAEARSGGAGAAGGSLSVTLNAGRTDLGETPPPARSLDLVANASGSTAGLTSASLASASAAHLGGDSVQLSAGLVRDGGFSDLSLQAAEKITVGGGVALDLSRQLNLDAPVLAMNGGTASLSAAQLFVGNDQLPLQSPGALQTRPLPQASGGSGTLTLSGGTTVLDGRIVTQGVGTLAIASDGDLRLQSRLYDGSTISGSLQTGAELTLSAAQIYPATGTRFTITAAGHGVTISGGGDAAAVSPQSAGGTLAINAARIVQDGVLRAPMGSITLTAEDSLSLGAGSLTSVSAAGQELLWGSVSGGHWTAPGNPSAQAGDASGPPAKSITLAAPAGSIDADAQARLDLSGGGKLLGWQFVPGPGGSTDIFSGSSGAFALVPSVQGLAPFDATLASTLPGAGRQLQITGSGGPIPPGTYTLLPARYAALAGAFLVQPVAGGTALASGTTLKNVDGTSLIGARLVDAGTSFGAALSSTWRVMSSAQAHQRSELDLSDANSFFADSRPALPVDAGRLVLNAAAMQFDASIAFAASRVDAAPGSTTPALVGRGGEAFVVSRDIVVGSATGQAGDALLLSTDMLNRLGAQTLVIGAAPDAAGALQVGAQTLSV
uniref:filamentous hemagglutinin N-terminal domain-containing protein n=1 Tax=Pelomonas sp. KK5 TaxID=1855730 RepID=UPI00118121AD